MDHFIRETQAQNCLLRNCFTETGAATYLSISHAG